MKTPERCLSGLLALALLAPAALAQQPAPAPAAATKATSIRELLERVQAGYRVQTDEDRKREAEFVAARDKQADLLKKARAQLAAEQKRGEAMEKEFDRNEATLTQLQETLRLRLGTMGELFGVIRGMAGEVRAHLDSSLVSAQFPGRGAQLEPLAKSKSLPSVEQLEKLWYLVLQEMAESGKVVRFQTTVVTADGQEKQLPVIRIGVFNAIAEGRYLNWLPEVGKLVELGRQPPPRYLAAVPELEAAREGYIRVAIDPARGSILTLLVQTPEFLETIPFGGLIGYLIIGLGILTFFIGLLRALVMVFIGWKVRRQQKKIDAPKSNNALGRVLLVYTQNPELDIETLEHKLDEAILRESARLEKLQAAIKVAAVVAPLMGLLGTITGMIKTFNAITLFGTGDPKLMAGGISEALVTTELGLIVAIPLVLLHAWLRSQSRSIVDVLEEQSAGMVARKAEQEKNCAPAAG